MVVAVQEIMLQVPGLQLQTAGLVALPEALMELVGLEDLVVQVAVVS